MLLSLYFIFIVFEFGFLTILWKFLALLLTIHFYFLLSTFVNVHIQCYWLVRSCVKAIFIAMKFFLIKVTSRSELHQLTLIFKISISLSLSNVILTIFSFFKYSSRQVCDSIYVKIISHLFEFGLYIISIPSSLLESRSHERIMSIMSSLKTYMSKCL